MLPAMRDFFFSLKLKLLDVAGLGGFFLVRRLERRLSPAALWRFWQPVAAGRVALNTLFKQDTAVSAHPNFLRGWMTVRQLRQRRRADYCNRVLKNFPDRLAAETWRARAVLEGREHWTAAQAAGRPVVLAFFHFGPIAEMGLWLRALGIPAASFSGGSASRRLWLEPAKDRRSPLPGVPNFFYADELRAAVKFLAPGNALLIAVDSPAEKKVLVPAGDGWNFEMATGALRLAARHQAVLIPFTIVDAGGWKFRLRLHQPVPAELLVAGDEFEQAAAHLLAEMLPVIQAHPEQCRTELVRRFKPMAMPASAANVTTGTAGC